MDTVYHSVIIILFYYGIYFTQIKLGTETFQSIHIPPNTCRGNLLKLPVNAPKREETTHLHSPLGFILSKPYNYTLYCEKTLQNSLKLLIVQELSTKCPSTTDRQPFTILFSNTLQLSLFKTLSFNTLSLKFIFQWTYINKGCIWELSGPICVIYPNMWCSGV